VSTEVAKDNKRLSDVDSWWGFSPLWFSLHARRF
jgi:hypothetical protein